MNLGLQIQKANVGIRISIFQIPCVPIFRQNRQLPVQICPNIGFLSLELAPPKYQLCQFFVKMDKFEFLDPNFGKLPNYVQYFGSNNIDGVAESWVEVQMSWAEVDGTVRPSLAGDLLFFSEFYDFI